MLRQEVLEGSEGVQLEAEELFLSETPPGTAKGSCEARRLSQKMGTLKSCAPGGHVGGKQSRGAPG